MEEEARKLAWARWRGIRRLHPSSLVTHPLRRLGHGTRRFLSEFGAFSTLAGQTLAYSGSIVRDRQLLFDQMEHIGTNSLPLVLVIGLFTGMVSAWQAAYQFKGLIPFSFLGAAVSRAIFIAGRVGASIDAELGTMKVTEQIDALESLAISPIR